MLTARQARDTSQVVLETEVALALLISPAPLATPRRDALAGAALRRMTGRDDIVIERRPSGRPRLVPPLPELGVSMSARGTWLAVGFSPSDAVGVDVELACNVPMQDVVRLASDHFAPAEARAVAARCDDARRAHDLFMRLWVAKEAVLKTTGRGVFDGLGGLDFASGIDQLCLDGCNVDITEGPSKSRYRVATRHLRDAHDSADGDLYCALATSTV